MPRASVSAEDHAANLDRRAEEARTKAMRQRIVIAMNNKPSVVPKLWAKLVSLGYDAETIKEVEQLPKSLAAQAVDRRRQVKKEVDEEMVRQSLEQETLGKPFQVKDPLPTKYWKLGELSIPMWRDKLLPRVEQRSLSAANLRALRGESGSKTSYCRIAEFITGLGAEFPLTGRYRCIEEIVTEFVSRSESRGRRGLDLPLPPDWERDGLFFVDEVNGAKKMVVDKQKWSGEEAEIPLDKLAPGGVPKKDELWIDSNWSEKKATLRRRGDSEAGYVLANDFEGHLIDCVADASNRVSPAKLFRKRALHNMEAKMEADDKDTNPDMNKCDLAAGMSTPKKAKVSTDDEDEASKEEPDETPQKDGLALPVPGPMLASYSEVGCAAPPAE